MLRHNFQGKTKEDAIEQAKAELNLTDDNYFVKEKEVKQGLFKGKKIEIEIIKKDDLVDYTKQFLLDIIKKMGLNPKIEIKKRQDNINITLYSENNNILIGKNGKTLDSLTIITKQMIRNEFGINFNLFLDVGEYKVKQQRNIERLAKDIAKEVSKTKIAAKLDSMNSYERRLIHNVLNDNRNVYTESEGEEPYRYVVIKPRD